MGSNNLRGRNSGRVGGTFGLPNAPQHQPCYRRMDRRSLHPFVAMTNLQVAQCHKLFRHLTTERQNEISPPPAFSVSFIPSNSNHASTTCDLQSLTLYAYP
jgi:hypothetical protein